MTKDHGIDRFGTPLYTVAEAARYLDVPDSTFRSWTHGYHRRSPDRALATDFGLEHALASRRLYTDGVPLSQLENVVRIATRPAA